MSTDKAQELEKAVGKVMAICEDTEGYLLESIKPWNDGHSLLSKTCEEIYGILDKACMGRPTNESAQHKEAVAKLANQYANDLCLNPRSRMDVFGFAEFLQGKLAQELADEWKAGNTVTIRPTRVERFSPPARQEPKATEPEGGEG